MTEIKQIRNSVTIFSEEANTFLNDKNSHRFLTQFTIGTNKLIFYGSPAHMRIASNLIGSYIQALAESNPPYELITFMEVMERPFTIIWLNLNGFDVEHLFTRLNLDEYLQMFDIITYFDCTHDDLLVKWVQYLNDYIKPESKDVIIINAQGLIEKINKLSPIIEFRPILINIIDNLYKMDISQVLDKLNYVLVIGAISGISYSPVDIVDRKVISDMEKLDKTLGELKFKRIPDSTYYTRERIGPSLNPNLTGGSIFELDIRPNVVILFNATGEIDKRLLESFIHHGSPLDTIINSKPQPGVPTKKPEVRGVFYGQKPALGTGLRFDIDFYRGKKKGAK